MSNSSETTQELEAEKRLDKFEGELREVLERNRMEGITGMPDIVVAAFLVDSVINMITVRRNLEKYALRDNAGVARKEAIETWERLHGKASVVA